MMAGLKHLLMSGPSNLQQLNKVKTRVKHTVEHTHHRIRLTAKHLTHHQTRNSITRLHLLPLQRLVVRHGLGLMSLPVITQPPSSILSQLIKTMAALTQLPRGTLLLHRPTEAPRHRRPIMRHLTRLLQPIRERLTRHLALPPRARGLKLWRVLHQLTRPPRTRSRRHTVRSRDLLSRMTILHVDLYVHSASPNKITFPADRKSVV